MAKICFCMFLIFMTSSCGFMKNDWSSTKGISAIDVPLTSSTQLVYSSTKAALILDSVNSPISHNNKASFLNGFKSVEWSDTSGGLKLADWTDYLISVPGIFPSVNGGFGQYAIDPVSGYLVVFKWVAPRALYIIDTKKNDNPIDDELITTYTPTTTPAMPDTWAGALAYDGVKHLLYFGTYSSGVYVFATKGTGTISDDELLGSYSKASGELNSNAVNSITVDSANDLVYISTNYESSPYVNNGVQIIDRLGTEALADDVSLRLYNQSNLTNFQGNGSNRITLVPELNQILVSNTSAGTFVAVDTKGTRDPNDDTVSYKFDGTSHPALLNHHGSYKNSYDSGSGLLLVESENWADYTKKGIFVVDTKKTAAGADDDFLGVLTSLDLYQVAYNNFSFEYDSVSKDMYLYGYNGLKRYTFNSISNLALNTVKDIPEMNGYSGYKNKLFDQTRRVLYLVGPRGVYAYTPDRLMPSGAYISEAISLASGGFSEVSLMGSSLDSTSLQYRTSVSSTAYVRDDLATSTAADWADVYGWGDSPSTVSASNGVIKLSGLTNNWGYYWLKLNVPPDTFPAGSTVKVKVKYNTSAVAGDVWVYENDWWSDGVTEKLNEWVEVSFRTSQSSLDNVGFYWNCQSGCSGTDNLEIDEVTITSGDGSWSAWSSPVASGSAINVDLSGATYLQYKLNMTSFDRITSPVVSEVNLQGSYATSGEEVYDLSLAGKVPVKFVIAQDVPAGTSILISYSTDGGLSWEQAQFIDNEYVFPATMSMLTSLKVKIQLGTADGRWTPKLQSLVLHAR